MPVEELESNNGIQIVLPLLISAYDYWRWQRFRPKDDDTAPDGSVYDAIGAKLTHGRFRYIPAACLLTLGGFLASSRQSGSRSTYICPIVLGLGRSIPLMQWLGVLLDCFLAVTAAELAQRGAGAGYGRRGRGSAVWAWVLLVSKTRRWSCIDVKYCSQNYELTKKK